MRPHRAVYCSLLPRLWPLAQSFVLPFAIRPIFFTIILLSLIVKLAGNFFLCFSFWINLVNLISVYSPPFQSHDCFSSLTGPSAKFFWTSHLHSNLRYIFSDSLFSSSLPRCISFIPLVHGKNLRDGHMLPVALCHSLCLFSCCFVLGFSAVLLFCFPCHDVIAPDHLPHFPFPPCYRSPFHFLLMSLQLSLIYYFIIDHRILPVTIAQKTFFLSLCKTFSAPCLSCSLWFKCLWAIFKGMQKRRVVYRALKLQAV